MDNITPFIGQLRGQIAGLNATLAGGVGGRQSAAGFGQQAAHVQLYNQQLDTLRETQDRNRRSVNQNNRALAGQSTVLGRAARNMAAYSALGLAAYGTFRTLNTAVSESINLTEAQNLGLEIFGARSTAVNQALERSNVQLGQSRAQATEAVGTFGAFFETLDIGSHTVGLFGMDIADLSLFFTQLATDIGSLRNVPFESVVERLQSGLAGEVRAVRQLGLNVYESQVSQEVERLGLRDLEARSEQQARTLARISLLTRQTALDQGDYVRTLHETANAARTAGANVRNLLGGAGRYLDEFAINPGLQAFNSIFLSLIHI